MSFRCSDCSLLGNRKDNELVAGFAETNTGSAQHPQASWLSGWTGWKREKDSAVWLCVCPLTANSSSVSPLSLMDATLWTRRHTYTPSAGTITYSLIPMLSKLDMQHDIHTHSLAQAPSKCLSGPEVRPLGQTRKRFLWQPKSRPQCVWCNEEMQSRESKVPVDCFNCFLTSLPSFLSCPNAYCILIHRLRCLNNLFSG